MNYRAGLQYLNKHTVYLRKENPYCTAFNKHKLKRLRVHRNKPR